MRLLPFISMLSGLVLALSVSACNEPDEAAERVNAPIVLAASSMQESLENAAEIWEGKGHVRPLLSFSSSAVVARQIEQGAPADLAIVADLQWFDWLQDKALVEGQTALVLAGNSLVVIAPLIGGSPSFGQRDFAQILKESTGPIAIGEPQSVPAGRYAKEAMVSLGSWNGLQGRLVPGENVRAVLALVERGEAGLGVVYASDAAASKRITIAARIDPALHQEVRITGAIIKGAKNGAEASAFLDFLASQEGFEVFRGHGFADFAQEDAEQ